MCRNGQYTERGIKQIHGFMSERWRIEPESRFRKSPRGKSPKQLQLGAGWRARAALLA